MCDYSLHALATRGAEVGEMLVATENWSATARGFAGADVTGRSLPSSRHRDRVRKGRRTDGLTFRRR